MTIFESLFLNSYQDWSDSGKFGKCIASEPSYSQTFNVFATDH